jgi:hypothetical protein
LLVVTEALEVASAEEMEEAGVQAEQPLAEPPVSQEPEALQTERAAQAVRSEEARGALLEEVTAATGLHGQLPQEAPQAPAEEEAAVRVRAEIMGLEEEAVPVSQAQEKTASSSLLTSQRQPTLAPDC